MCFKIHANNEHIIGLYVILIAIYVLVKAQYGNWGYGYSATQILSDTFVSGSATGQDNSYLKCQKPVLNQEIQVNIRRQLKMSKIEFMYPQVTDGGSFRPADCRPSQRVAIVVPFRDRYHQLLHLLQRLHEMLQQQKRDYTIFVLNQAYDDIFNKGKLINSGVREILDNQNNKYDCFIFHDVDMLPLDNRNIYSCGENPRHLSPALDEMRFLLPYYTLTGGVLALTHNQLIKSNGYSNEYWGWGAEDDDMYERLIEAGYSIDRPHPSIGRYIMLKHAKRERSTERYNKLSSWKDRWLNDGQSNIKDIGYKVLSKEFNKLYTNITIDVGSSPKEHKDSLENDKFLASSRFIFTFVFTVLSISLFKFI